MSSDITDQQGKRIRKLLQTPVDYREVSTDELIKIAKRQGREQGFSKINWEILHRLEFVYMLLGAKNEND